MSILIIIFLILEWLYTIAMFANENAPFGYKLGVLAFCVIFTFIQVKLLKRFKRKKAARKEKKRLKKEAKQNKTEIKEESE